MKFLCLAYEEEQKLNALSRREWSVLRDDTLSYVAQLKRNGQLIAAEPLQSVRTAKTVRVRDGKVLCTDGPFAETKETLGGFFLINARDQEEALEIASKWPSAALGSIEVRPLESQLREESRYL